MRISVNRFSIYLFFLFFLLMPLSVFAKPILIIVPDVKKITVAPGSSGSVNYTVTNNTTKTVTHLTVQPGFNTNGNPAGISLPSNNCAAAVLTPGASCTFQVLIQEKGQPSSFTLSPRVCAYNDAVCSQPVLKDRLLVTIGAVFTTEVVLTAAGQDATGGQPPLVSASTDGGNTWAVKSVSGLPVSGYFSAASCTGSGLTAICTATGQDQVGSGPALVAVSTDGSHTWAVKSVTGLPVNGVFYGTSCTGSGSTAICVAAGVTGGTAALLAVSTDGGNNWAVTPVTGRLFKGVSCTGIGSTAICTAAGVDNTGGFPPLVTVSTDGGNTWVNKSVTGLPASGYFTSASCTGVGATAVCTAAGQNGVGTFPPIVAVSTDGGITWAVKSVTGLPTKGVFNAISCTGTGSTAICTAAGQNFNGSQPPILAVSTDGGNTWTTKSVTGLPTAGFFNSASCTGTGSTAICIAAGRDLSTAAPFLAVSTDGGNTWAAKSVTGLPASGSFYGASCTGTGPTAICAAAGQNNAGSAPPFVAVSTNGAITWAVKSVTGLPVSGSFGATGAAGGS